MQLAPFTTDTKENLREEKKQFEVFFLTANPKNIHKHVGNCSKYWRNCARTAVTQIG